MKIKNINETKDYDNNHNLSRLNIGIEFETSGDESKKVGGEALYYLLCALAKYKNKEAKDLDISTKTQIYARLDLCKDKIKELERDLFKCV